MKYCRRIEPAVAIGEASHKRKQFVLDCLLLLRPKKKGESLEGENRNNKKE